MDYSLRTTNYQRCAPVSSCESVVANSEHPHHGGPEEQEIENQFLKKVMAENFPYLVKETHRSRRTDSPKQDELKGA